MNMSNYRSLMGVIAFSVIAFCAVAIGGCNTSSVKTTEQPKAAKGMDISIFAKGAYTQEPKIVDCETAEGTKLLVTS